MPGPDDDIPLNRNTPPFLGKDGISMLRKHEDDIRLPSYQRLRGIESITLDLKKPESLKVFLDLVQKAEILFENRARGGMSRLGAGYEDIQKLNPSIVFRVTRHPFPGQFTLVIPHRFSTLLARRVSPRARSCITTAW
ncbi:MAG: hypothetical protein CMK09_01065 [Ponticaulis sp.]|nr:hypothetical protein [Ponticaulis sp.]|tara:strand:- start:6510 stop:6923 length:414 start_codon:yes stop_codon:yes gene_type:complete